jgi:hypothetical protein
MHSGILLESANYTQVTYDKFRHIISMHNVTELMVSVLLGYDIVSLDNKFPTFQDNAVVSFSSNS